MSCQMVRRNISMAGKILHIEVIVTSDGLFVDELPEYPVVVRQKPFAAFKCFLLMSMEILRNHQ